MPSLQRLTSISSRVCTPNAQDAAYCSRITGWHRGIRSRQRLRIVLRLTGGFCVSQKTIRQLSAVTVRAAHLQWRYA